MGAKHHKEKPNKRRKRGRKQKKERKQKKKENRMTANMRRMNATIPDSESMSSLTSDSCCFGLSNARTRPPTAENGKATSPNGEKLEPLLLLLFLFLSENEEWTDGEEYEDCFLALLLVAPAPAAPRLNEAEADDADCAGVDWPAPVAAVITGGGHGDGEKSAKSGGL